MKTPWFDPTPGGTARLLLTRKFVDVDLYTFKLAGAPLGVSALYYSAGDVPVAIPGSIWPKTVTFDQDKAKAVGHWKVGLDVDQWQVVIAPRNIDQITGAAFPDAIGSQPFLSAVQGGVLDGAEVQVDRAFAPAWPVIGRPMVPTGIVTIFYGRVAEVDVGRTQCSLTVNSHLNLLSNQAPRNLFQASCVHTLFDPGCTLSAAAFAVRGNVAARGPTANSFVSAIAAPAGSGTYALGRVTMTGGASQGFSRTVRSWSAATGIFTLVAPFPFGIAPSDSFTAYPGCDKTFGTCGRFGNQANYGGALGVPTPETAV